MKKLQKIKLLILDFDGVMTDNRVLVQEDGKEAVFCNRGDGLAIEIFKKTGIEIWVISKEKNKVVQARCKKLKIKCFYGVDDKYKLFLNIIKEKKVNPECIGFVGNDINDLKIMENVGCSIAPSDASREIKDIANIITKRKGGEGVIRELLDMFLT